MIYLVVFLISSALLFIKSKTKKKGIKHALLAVALLLPCCLAALRDVKIGTDVSVYLSPLYEASVNSNSYGDYLKYEWRTTSNIWVVSSVEPLFALLVYVISNIFANIHILFFVIQLVIIVAFYGAMRRMIDEKYHWISYLMFLLALYNSSLNMMRQIMGISIALYGLSYVVNRENSKKMITFAVISVIAFFVHYSSIMIILPYLLLKIASDATDGKKRIVISKIAILLLIVLLAFMLLFIYDSSLLMNILGIFGLQKYALYLSGSISIGPITLIKMVPPAVCLLLALIIGKNNADKEYKALIWLSAVHLILLVISTKTVYASRICYIFDAVECLLIPKVICSNNKRTVPIFITLLAYVAVWAITFIVLNASETVPYRFFWQ